MWALQRGPSRDLCIVRLPRRFAAPPLAPGERWLFGLHARIGQKDATTGRRRSWRVEDTRQRLRWLERRGAEHGFVVVTAPVEAVREPVRKPGAAFWLDRSAFSGAIEIAEPEKVKAEAAYGEHDGARLRTAAQAPAGPPPMIRASCAPLDGRGGAVA